MEKIVIYAGYQVGNWTDYHPVKKGLGGSEQAVFYLSQELKNFFEVYVCFDKSNNEDRDGIKYRSIKTIRSELRDVKIKSLIAMNYINYLLELNGLNFDASFLWMHNLNFFSWYRGALLPLGGENLLHDNRLKKIVGVSKWHESELKKIFNRFSNKITSIDNGISIKDFKKSQFKIKDSLIYCSAPNRAFLDVVDNWQLIKKNLVSPKIHICVPQYCEKDWQRDEYKRALSLIDYEFYGCLPKLKLYDLLSKMEYWYYPTKYKETFCVTALEILGHNITPITSGIAGLKNTLSNFNCKNFSSKNDVKKVRDYLLNFDWKIQAKKWVELIESN
jgi:hypothetical protein